TGTRAPCWTRTSVADRRFFFCCSRVFAVPPARERERKHMEGTAATPSSAPTTTGPASFSDLPSTAWSDASSASTPTSDVAPTDNAGAATTAPPVETQTPEGQPQQAGEPPKERWADILSNARTKAAEEALAPYAWAKQIPQQEFQQIQNLARTLSADPVAGLQQLIAEIRKD